MNVLLAVAVVLSTAVTVAAAPPQVVEADCTGGKLTWMALKVPEAGFVFIEIPANICDMVESRKRSSTPAPVPAPKQDEREKRLGKPDPKLPLWYTI